MTWNSCAPIHVVINPAGAPEGGVEDMLDSLTKLSEATALTFTYDGLVDNALHESWGQGPEAGFEGWAPVLIGWTTPASGLLEDVTGGRTYTARVSSGQDATYVSAMVAINATRDAHRTPGFDQASSRGSLYLHELAHVVGLGHTDDRGQLMHPDGAFGDRFAAGDRAGLALLGSQGCLPVPATTW